MKFESKVSIALVSHILKTTTPIVLRGKMLPAGTFIDVSPSEAANLKSRSRAVDATYVEFSASEQVFASGTIDDSAEIMKLICDRIRCREPEFYNAKAAIESMRDIGSR